LWLQFDGQPTPLQEAIQRTNSNVLIEHSPDLLVEGDIVRVVRNAGSTGYRFCGQNGEALKPLILAQ
jgi:hypothetical protein